MNETSISYKYIGELPDGYQYKLINQEGAIKIIGVSLSKAPIGFWLTPNELRKIAVEDDN